MVVSFVKFRKASITVIICMFLIIIIIYTLYKCGIINLKETMNVAVGDFVAGSLIAILLHNFDRISGKKAEGKLQVSDIIVQPNEVDKTCTLDFRVHNSGSSDVQINRVNFKVLDVKEIGILAPQSFSEVYGLDISELKEIGDISKDSILHQNIEPAKSDRFAIVLTAKKITGYRLWKLEPKLITNFGEVLGQPVEIWLPYIFKQLSQSSKEQMDRELEEMERELKASK